LSQALLNGTPVDSLALHRGLHYGDGVFRTCLVLNNVIIDLERQLKILSGDAAALGLSCEDLDSLRLEARQLAQSRTQAVLKMLLLRAGQERGYRASCRAADRLLCLYEAPRYPALCWERGVEVFRCGFRLAAQPALAGIKHLNRLEQVLASREWQTGAEEALLEDEAGRPHCGSRSNLFWVSESLLRTPALEHCGVAGMMRGKLLELAAEMDIPVRIAAGSWEELESSQEAFVCNSLIGIWPLRALGRRSWAAPGPLTRALMERLRHPRLADC
jgi:4-amino-4-deoxychorismate lyase